MEFTGITIEKIGDRGFVQVSENTWRKNLFEGTYLYLIYQDDCWMGELRLLDNNDAMLESRVFSKFEFDGETLESLYYVCLRITGDVL